jgi:hypothetical protein
MEYQVQILSKGLILVQEQTQNRLFGLYKALWALLLLFIAYFGLILKINCYGNMLWEARSTGQERVLFLPVAYKIKDYTNNVVI